MSSPDSEFKRMVPTVEQTPEGLMITRLGSTRYRLTAPFGPIYVDRLPSNKIQVTDDERTPVVSISTSVAGALVAYELQLILLLRKILILPRKLNP